MYNNNGKRWNIDLKTRLTFNGIITTTMKLVIIQTKGVGAIGNAALKYIIWIQQRIIKFNGKQQHQVKHNPVGIKKKKI